MENFIFINLPDLWRLFVINNCAYVALIIMLRSACRSTPAKMNAFDFVITIRIGSVLAIIMMNKTVPFIEGIAALALLIGLQFIITWPTVNFKALRDVVRSSPTLLLYDGDMIEKKLKKERVNDSVLMDSLRNEVVHSIIHITAFVIETIDD